MKKYELNFLTDREFNALSLVNPRYHPEDALGMADMQTNRIFIRKSNIKLLDQFILAHEIEEILSRHSEDELDGVRYKKGRDIFGAIAPIALAFIPGIGPALSAVAAGGYTGYKVSKGEAKPWQIPVSAGLAYAGGRLGQAAPGYQAGVEASKQVGGGVIGQTLSGVQGMLGFTPGAATAAQRIGMPAAGGMGLAPSAIGQYARGAGFFAPITTLGPSAVRAGAQAGAPVARIAGQPITYGQTIQGAQAGAPGIVGTPGVGAQVTTRTPMLERLLGANWRQTLTGAAIPLVGGMFTPGPEPFTPEQSALFQETANMVRQGAQVQLTPAQQQTITANFDTALEQARQNIIDRYKALRPGSDISTDSQFRETMVELETDFAEKKANALAGAQLGLSQIQTAMMSELAAMDINTLAMKAGISYAESRDFKNLLAQVGFLVAQSGQPIYVR